MSARYRLTIDVVVTDEAALLEYAEQRVHASWHHGLEVITDGTVGGALMEALVLSNENPSPVEYGIEIDTYKHEALTYAEAIAAQECGCGHPYHGNRLCTGTLATVSDSDMVAHMVRNGVDPNEPCVCAEYVPQ